MNEKPIIFSGEMVRAIQDERKTQTRRVVVPQPDTKGLGWAWGYADRRKIPNGPRGAAGGDVAYMSDSLSRYCPYGQPGDHLWVRETFGILQPTHADSIGQSIDPFPVFRANGDEAPAWDEGPFEFSGWKPSIHMPRWASRITLEVISVRVERVQDISEEDAEAEGCETERIPYLHNGQIVQMDIRSPRAVFSVLWDSINAKRGYSWDSNPWVWVVEFARSNS